MMTKRKKFGNKTVFYGSSIIPNVGFTLRAAVFIILQCHKVVKAVIPRRTR